MADILRTDGVDNIGGIRQIEFVEQYNVDSIGQALNGQLSSAEVVLKAGKSWSVLEATVGSIVPSVKVKETDQGEIWNVKFKSRLPKQSNIKGSQLYAMKGRPYLLRVTDNNEIITLVGSISEKVMMRFNPINSEGVNTYNGYEVEFSGEFSNEPLYLV